MPTSERRILRDFLGWMCLCGGGLAVALWLAPPEGDAQSYLTGVWMRSLARPFQSVLLAAVIATLPHAVWVRARQGLPALPDYERFAQWAQTLFTSLGFMGTIIGVSIAVSGLEDAMSLGDPAALIGGLSTAFDTTFLGLFGAVSLMIFRRLGRLMSLEAT